MGGAHESVRRALIGLGTLLGFHARAEASLPCGHRAQYVPRHDVVWYARAPASADAARALLAARAAMPTGGEVLVPLVVGR